MFGVIGLEVTHDGTVFPIALTLVQSAAPPGNSPPNTLVKIVPCNFCYDFEASNRAGNLDSSREKPADRERIQGSERTPADGLENRS